MFPIQRLQGMQMTTDDLTAAAPSTLPWPQTENKDAAATMHLLGGMLQAELRRAQPGLAALSETEVHAPTLLSAIGVIAGYAAQCAAAHAILAGTKKRQADDLIRVGCEDGSVLYYGDEINRHLIIGPHSTHALSGFLAGAVIQAGYRRADLADAAELLRHISEVACTPAYDLVRAPASHAPLWNVSGILRCLWPKARVVLEHRITPATVSRPLGVQHWPVAAAIVAQQYIMLGKDLVPPPVAMAIILESALKASKRRLIGAYASPLATQEDAFFGRRAS